VISLVVLAATVVLLEILLLSNTTDTSAFVNDINITNSEIAIVTNRANNSSASGTTTFIVYTFAEEQPRQTAFKVRN